MTDKIVCFGKNYVDHMLELGDAPVDKPVIFLKPPSILKQCSHWDETINVTLTQEETHFECELVIKLKAGGYHLTQKAAEGAMGWYTIGLDMTLRQLQSRLKQASHPWTIAKVFPDAAVIGPWIKIHDLDFLKEAFQFTLDSVVRQKSHGSEMIFNPVELIMYASQFFPLCEGDILFTGTPSGVGVIHDNAEGVLHIGDRKYGIIVKQLPCFKIGS